MRTFHCILLAISLLAIPVSARSQTYSRTERIEYEDHPTQWVLGQVRKTQCMASIPADAACDGQPDSMMTETSYDPTWAVPLVSKQFGKIVQTLTYETAAAVSTGQRGTLKTVKDGNNNVTTATDWKRGIPRHIRYPATPESPSGAVETAVVNDSGWITSVTDETESKTCYQYDAMGRVSKITYPSESPNVCDASVWKETTIDFSGGHAAAYGMPAGHWRQTTLTGHGRKILIFDALWRPVVEQTLDLTNVANTHSEIITRYDTSGRVAFASYPMRTNGAAVFTDTALKGTHTTYDALDRVHQVKQDWEGTGQLTTTTAYLSNAEGPYVQVTNPRGVITRTWHRSLDRPRYDNPWRIQHGNGYAYTDINRDIHDKPLSIVRRNAAGTVSLTRSYVYNANQELCRAVEPETGATLMGYDGAGNLAWSASGLASSTACHATGNTAAINGRKAARTYDARNRLSTLTFPQRADDQVEDGAGDQAWQYTPDGLPSLVTTKEHVTGHVVTNSYTYNRRRLLTYESQAITNWGTFYLTHTYNSNGHLSHNGWPGGYHGPVVAYTPNALGQPTTAGTFASGAIYHPNGALKQFTYGNGVVHTLTQNARGLPETSRDALGATEYIDDTYAYDQHGNVLAITDGSARNQQGNRDMTYDALDRLTNVVSGNGPSAAMFGTAAYTYDVLDNLTRVHVTGGANPRNHYYCYDANWRLAFARTGPACTGTASPAAITFEYDPQGNLSTKNANAYTFDYGNRLRDAPGRESRYYYDAHGRRAGSLRSVNGTSWLRSAYSLDGKLVFQQDQGLAIRKDFIYLGDNLIAERIRNTSTGTPVTVRYQHTDALGSPVVVTNESGAPAELERSYFEPYGQVALRIGNPIPRNGIGFTGHVEDAATGLNYMQQRYYEPGIGMMLSVDPVTAYKQPITNFCRYCYARNNPYKFIDPDGNEGKVAWLVKLTANGMRKVGRITQEQAVRARRAEQNVVADRRQMASQIETASRGGRDGQLKHAAHELEDGSKGLPHYQTEGKRGHAFWGKLSVATIAAAGALDQVAEAAEYIPDPAPRPAEQSDVSRWNNAMGTISEATGLPMPGVKMGQDGGFQGYFRVEGRIDSKRLSEGLDKRR